MVKVMKKVKNVETLKELPKSVVEARHYMGLEVPKVVLPTYVIDTFGMTEARILCHFMYLASEREGMPPLEQQDGLAWWYCSQSELADRFNVSLRTLKTAMAILLESGVLLSRGHSRERKGPRRKYAISFERYAAITYDSLMKATSAAAEGGTALSVIQSDTTVVNSPGKHGTA